MTPGVTEPGLNEQFKPDGSPEQVRATVLLNDPDVGATLTVSVPEFPEAIVIREGSVPMVRPEADPDPEPVVVPLPQATVAVTPADIRFVILGFPIAWTNRV